jgi:multiple antibiotic resistance protein
MNDALSAFVRAVIFALATLLPIINPPGSAPIFLSMTPRLPGGFRAKLARRIARNSFVLLVAAMLAGSYVLIFLGLSLPIIKIAGGLVVIGTAWRLVNQEHSPDADIVLTHPSKPPADTTDRDSFYPLTFPLTVGPGSIVAAVTLGAGVRVDDTPPWVVVVGAMVGIAVVAVTVYLCYRFAQRLLGLLGGAGAIVVLRLSAFILLAAGVKILCDGLVERFEG